MRLAQLARITFNHPDIMRSSLSFHEWKSSATNFLSGIKLTFEKFIFLWNIKPHQKHKPQNWVSQIGTPKKKRNMACEGFWVGLLRADVVLRFFIAFIRRIWLGWNDSCFSNTTTLLWSIDLSIIGGNWIVFITLKLSLFDNKTIWESKEKIATKKIKTFQTLQKTFSSSLVYYWCKLCSKR